MSKYKYRIYNGKSIKNILKYSVICLLILMFVAGLIIGSSTQINNSELAEKISVLTDSYISVRAGQGVLTNFCNSLSINIMFNAINIFFAFSVIGYPFIIIIPLLKGLGLGAVCGYLYSAHKMLGLGYSLIMLYPGAIVSTLALIFAFNDSCEYSKNLYNKSIKNRGQYEKDETRVYLTRQLVFAGICAVSAVIESLTNHLFSRFFEI